MIYVLVALSIFCGAIGAYQWVEPPPEEEQVAVVMDMTDTENPQEGWYSYRDNQWTKWDDGDGKSPPESKVAAYASQKMDESVFGLTCIASIFLIVFILLRRRKRAGSPKDGMTPLQYQALLRRLDTVAAIVENVTPTEDVKVLEKRGKKYGK